MYYSLWLMNRGLLTAVFLPKMLPYHCRITVDRGKNRKPL